MTEVGFSISLYKVASELDFTIFYDDEDGYCKIFNLMLLTC